MWNILFYVKGDGPKQEYNYCVSQVLDPLFGLAPKLGSLADHIKVQCKRREAIYEVVRDSPDEGLSWVPSGYEYFEGTRRFTLSDQECIGQLTKSATSTIRVDDMASPAAVADFVKFGLAQKTAGSRNCLIVWGHGGGQWSGILKDPNTKQVILALLPNPRKEEDVKSFHSLP